MQCAFQECWKRVWLPHDSDSEKAERLQLVNETVIITVVTSQEHAGCTTVHAQVQHPAECQPQG